ncbi:hypothetical protein M8C13_02265 [Crossiella sp. SN42]|uniref:hypothetical protein n=1 Tax=Crossiella sp. SN42 TaxID=2944808 RepID=UPI00207CD5E3|nr:hypothetical protein [Crossiella sp. SN42]MCO1574581.1 hypothetical protein [Crossiella sp. SN42]
MGKTITGVLLAAAAVVTCAATPAQAAPSYWCTVKADNVNYRAGPGPIWISLGQANRGQRLTLTPPVTARGTDGQNWRHGDLWGGLRNVWIRADFLTC